MRTEAHTAKESLHQLIQAGLIVKRELSEAQNHLATASVEKIELERKITEVSTEAKNLSDKLRNQNDISLITGRWRMTYINNKFQLEPDGVIDISDSNGICSGDLRQITFFLIKNNETGAKFTSLFIYKITATVW